MDGAAILISPSLLLFTTPYKDLKISSIRAPLTSTHLYRETYIQKAQKCFEWDLRANTHLKSRVGARLKLECYSSGCGFGNLCEEVITPVMTPPPKKDDDVAAAVNFLAPPRRVASSCTVRLFPALFNGELFFFRKFDTDATRRRAFIPESLRSACTLPRRLSTLSLSVVFISRAKMFSREI